MIWSATNLGVTNSERAMSKSLVVYINFTSPILSERNGMRQDTVLLLTLVQFWATTVNNAMVSLMILTLLSFQSLRIPFTNLAKPSVTSAEGWSPTIYSLMPLKPSTLSCHLVSSNKATFSELNVSLTFCSASSLLKPAPRSSSPTSLPAAALFAPPAAALAEGFSVSFGFAAGFLTSSFLSSFSSSSQAGWTFLGAAFLA